MIPLYVLLGTTIVLRVLGHAGVVYLQDWRHVVRASLGAMFLLTASAHWGKRRPDLISMVPPVFSRPAVLVTLTGIFEVLGAIALQIPKLAPLAASGLFFLLILLFPANVFAANHRLCIGGRPVPRLLPRTVIQIVFLFAIWFAGR